MAVVNSLKKHLRYFSRKLKSPSTQIKKLLSIAPNLSFNDRNKTFTISNENLTPYERADIRSILMSRLQEIMPLTSVKIDDIVTDYYDQCLERYLYERINRKKSNEETCWFKYAQNNKCIGWIDKDEPFNSEDKIKFLHKLSQKKPYYKDEKLAELLEKDKNGYIFLRSSHVYKDDDKALALFRNIEKNGFSNFKSSFAPIILGYSNRTERYNVVSGRHRIAAVRYLRSQGIIKDSLKIRCHLIKYPFESLVFTRPYTGICKKCDWGGILDPGTGTHQDFFVREGIAAIRGHLNKKGGRQKWERIRHVFSDAVSNRTVLDIGSYRGLFCLKALEYGAKKTTALEISPELTSVAKTIKSKYCLDDFETLQGDFYDDNVYKGLEDNRHDTLFLFGIIHHLLRTGIQRGILFSFSELLRRISNISNHSIIVEFSMPKEESLDLPELVQYREAFTQGAFEESLQETFPNYSNLGRCDYRSGNKHGRYIYYALKQ